MNLKVPVRESVSATKFAYSVEPPMVKESLGVPDTVTDSLKVTVRFKLGESAAL